MSKLEDAARALFEGFRALAVGDTIRDNDPRMRNRLLRVERFEAHAQDNRTVLAVVIDPTYPRRREFRVRVARIFTDGKPRRYGFNRVP